MGGSTLQVRDTEHVVDRVLLRFKTGKVGDRDYVTFDLFADNQGVTNAGFIIDGMTVMDKAGLEELAGVTFEMDADSEDALNDLTGCTIYEPGRPLQLAYLKIVFGSLQGDSMDIRLEASCFGPDLQTAILEQDIPVTGDFVAKIEG
jgi:hypothetical protein